MFNLRLPVCSLLLAGMLFACSCNSKGSKYPVVKIATSLGDIRIELYEDKAPRTAGAFLQYVNKGLYKRASFYRVMKTDGVEEISNTGFIQGGIWHTDPQKVTMLPETVHEPTSMTGLTHTDGVISMARTSNESARTEFFICIGDQSPMDAGRRGSPDGLGYAAFGKVIEGMPVVRKIQAQNSHGDQFDEKIKITISKE